MMNETALILPRKNPPIDTSLKSQCLCWPRRTLPPELNVVILLLLAVPDILNCRRVSRTFRRLIDDTSALQYLIELYMNGVTPLSLPSTLCSQDRLQSLRSHLHIRNTLVEEFVSAHAIDLSFGRHWHFARDGLFASILQGCIKVQRLPSPIREIPSGLWEINTGDPLVIAIDSSQDLLLTVKAAGDRMVLSPYSLTSGKQHPLAINHSIDTLPPALDLAEYDLFVKEDTAIFQVLYQVEMSREFMCFAHDWKSGSTGLVFGASNVYEGLLLDLNYYMIVYYRPSEHAFVLGVVDASTDHQTDIDFLLPRLQNNVDFSIADVHLSSGSSLPVIPIIKGSAFTSAQANTRDSLITLKFMPDTETTHLIVISAWRLQQCIIRERQGMTGDCHSTSTVQWYSWGPQCTTLLTDIPRSVQSIGGVQPVDGTRLIMSDEASKRLAIYEFGRFVVRQAERVNPSSVLGHFSFVECDSLFKDHVLSCLPYIKHVTERKDDNNIVIGMANDYIVLIKDHKEENEDTPCGLILSF